MDISRRLDYLTMTHHNTKHWLKMMPTFIKAARTHAQLRPFPRYKTAYELEPSGRIDIADDDDQGVMFTWTGQDMSDAITAGVTFHQMISEACRVGKVTRLDFATDIRQNPLSDSPLWQEIQAMVANGKFKSSGKPAAEYQDKKNGGYTQYFGSYKSDQFIRIYDKLAQTGLLLQAMKQHLRIDHWTRVEVVTKGKYADNLAVDMMVGGWQRVGAAKLKKMLTFPLIESWDAVTEGEPYILTKQEKPMPKWRKWMDTQVLQSISQHAENPEDREFLLQWLQVVTDIVWNANPEKPAED